MYDKDELAYYIEKFLRQFEISECEISNLIEVVMQTNCCARMDGDTE